MMKSRSYGSIAMPWPRHSARAIASAVSRSESTSVPSRSNKKPRIAIAVAALYHAIAVRHPPDDCSVADVTRTAANATMTVCPPQGHARSLMQRWFLLGCFAVVACANHAQQAVALYETGDYAGAARAADSGLASHPGDEGLWQMRVRAALALGDAAGVAQAYAAYRGQLSGDDDKPLVRELAI